MGFSSGFIGHKRWGPFKHGAWEKKQSKKPFQRVGESRTGVGVAREVSKNPSYH